MRSMKKSGNRVKESTKAAIKSKTLPAPKTEVEPKRLTKKLALKEDAVSEQGNLITSKSLGRLKSSQWQQEPAKLEQPKTNHFLEDLVEKTDLERVIEEIESKGSSSEQEDFEETKEEMEPELDLPIAEDNKILDFDISSIEMSASEEEVDAEGLGNAESETNFLDVFGKVPEFDEVSLDLLEETEAEKKTQPDASPQHLATKSSTVADSGEFLDPVTGLRPSLDLASSFRSLTEDKLSDEESTTETADKSEHEGWQTEQQYLSLTDDISKEESEKSVELAANSPPNEDITFDLFLESIKPEEHAIPEEVVEDHDTFILDQQKLATEKAVTDFLNKMIDHCVAKAEYNESDVMARRSLDKHKLMCELKNICELLELEKSKALFLNKKTVNYYRRKGSLRPIAAELPNALAVNRANFETSLNVLDKWLYKEQQTKALHASQICVVKQQFEDMKHESLEQVGELERLMTTTFQRKNFDKLRTSVERLIRKMSAARKEISQVRFRLLLQQHQFSLLKNKLQQLEDLGNGLNIRQYESLQTDTLAVSKKIEEHDNALDRLHRHFNDDLHKIAHVKEKQGIIQNIKQAQKQFLEEVLLKERLLRKQIHRLKLQRNQLKAESKHLMHQTGLLSNQVLLRDYDKTVERANKLRQTNEDLRRTIKELNSKIDKLS